ncbi:hypothetical protein [Nonomuraea typhae]|uniref:hypothetical protein n=1 Tax=Nonomuraea typhae TaxID=2603600 RepID=UPI0012FAB94D|nr:hypothetical protein [Nonomuraea typhae]
MNVAEDTATVGVQAETVHGDVTVYQIPADPTPEERFAGGVHRLLGGMADEAREPIKQAVADGYVTGRSCFYLILALLSGRTVQQLSKDDLHLLHDVRGKLTEPPSRWTDAIRVVNRILLALEKDADADAVEDELKVLDADLREEVQRHLEIFLNGPVQAKIWARVFDAAKEERLANERLERAWKFFHADPAPPRVRRARPVTITVGAWVLTVASTVLAAGTLAYLAALAWQKAIPALLLCAAGAWVFGRHAAIWRFRAQRRWATDRAYDPARSRPAPIVDRSFVRKLDHQLRRYFRRYLPVGAERERWLAETAGIRQALRDEVAELYREDRIPADRVIWLIRHLVCDVRDRWERGTLWAYREQLRIPFSVKARCVLGAAALATGAGMLAWNAIQVNPFAAVLGLILGAAGGWFSGFGWVGFAVERRRHRADKEVADRQRADRQRDFERWTAKLAGKPADQEMAHWLECDRKALMEKAMRHYKLEAKDIITHAFIEAPAFPCKRASVPDGPWRYSRYTLLVFLLTADGVRQMSAVLDFEKAGFHGQRRDNYRYDQVGAVHVSQADDGYLTFELTLVNGKEITLEISGPDPDADEPEEEDERTVNQVTLDTAGLGNTLHVLEGIAAEGKEWIAQERRREERRLPLLADATAGLLA